MNTFVVRFAALCIGLTCASLSTAAGGPLGIDHRVNYDNSGIWARHHQRELMVAMLAGEGAIALWEGGDTRLGKTAWQAVDSTVVSGVAVQLLKMGFSRERPNSTDDPNQWFQGNGNRSFPSGEATLTSTIVMPFILEYHQDHPWVYALAALPAYDAVARVKVWGHWQTDVIAGLALGTTTAWFMHRREVPLSFSVLPHGFEVGLKKRW
jgi:undecaprenyl-diphosphatase